MQNNRIIHTCISLIFLFLLTLFSPITLIHAQSANNQSVQGAASLGVARMVEVEKKDVKNGSILSNGPVGLAVLSTVAYDPQVLGIVARDAAIIVSNANAEKSVPVIANGTVYVLVSSKNGAIKKGDLLTSSTIPGAAVKADKDGYVIGSALEEYANTDTKAVGTIAVELNLHYFNSKPTFIGSLSDIFKIALLPTKDSPTPIFKYMIAGGVALTSFVLTFMTFGRSAAKGVEALGRNPAASRIIHLGIIFNVGICVVITFVGLTVAFLILRL
jgi:hypothetical protein